MKSAVLAVVSPSLPAQLQLRLSPTRAMPGSSNADIATLWLGAGKPRPGLLSSVASQSAGSLPPSELWPSSRPGSARSTSRVVASSQDIGHSRLSTLHNSGARTPRPEHHDLAAKIEDAGIPKRYLRTLSAMGFEDVEQLLYLGRLGQPLDEILDDPLMNLSPGHRVTMSGWLQREAAAADASLRAELKALRNEAAVGRTATDIIQAWMDKQASIEERYAELQRENEKLRRQVPLPPGSCSAPFPGTCTATAAPPDTRAAILSTATLSTATISSRRTTSLTSGRAGRRRPRRCRASVGATRSRSWRARCGASPSG